MKNIFIILISLLLLGCKSVQKVVEVPVRTTTVDTIKTSEITNEEREYNQAIFDSLVITINEIKTGVSKDCDSICNEKIQNELSKISSSKHSGDNFYKLEYDKLSKKLKLINKIGKTQNIKKETSKDKETSSVVYQDVIVEVPVEIEVNILTWWQKILMWCGGISLLYFSFKIGRKFSLF